MLWEDKNPRLRKSKESRCTKTPADSGSFDFIDKGSKPLRGQNFHFRSYGNILDVMDAYNQATIALIMKRDAEMIFIALFKDFFF